MLLLRLFLWILLILTIFISVLTGLHSPENPVTPCWLAFLTTNQSHRRGKRFKSVKKNTIKLVGLKLFSRIVLLSIERTLACLSVWHHSFCENEFMWHAKIMFMCQTPHTKYTNDRQVAYRSLCTCTDCSKTVLFKPGTLGGAEENWGEIQILWDIFMPFVWNNIYCTKHYSNTFQLNLKYFLKIPKKENWIILKI